MADYNYENRMNLVALQRIDRSITGILGTASQVALYKYNGVNGEWEPPQIEGTLFVFERSILPSNGFIIMNRLNVNNKVEPITHNLEFQLQEPFLLYRNANNEINGIWFYDRDECARIGQYMNSLSQYASAEQSETKASFNQRQRRASESDSLHDSKASETENGDIVSLLTKALNDYKCGLSPSKKQKKPSKSVSNGASESIVKPTPIRAEPHLFGSGEQALTALSVEALFASAGKTDHPQNKKTQKLNRKANADSSTAILKRLMSNPENTLEHIERQMNTESNDKIKQSPVTSVEKEVKEQSNYSPSETNVPSLSEENKPSSSNVTTLQSRVMTPSMFTQLPAQSKSNESNSTPVLQNQAASSPLNFIQPSDPPLLSPMVFKQSPAPFQPLVAQSASSPAISNLVGPSGDEGTLLETADHSSDLIDFLPKAKPVPKNKFVPLTKLQLSQALIHLLENDEHIITKVHEAYVKSLESSFLRKS